MGISKNGVSIQTISGGIVNFGGAIKIAPITITNNAASSSSGSGSGSGGTSGSGSSSGSGSGSASGSGTGSSSGSQIFDSGTANCLESVITRFVDRALNAQANRIKIHAKRHTW